MYGLAGHPRAHPRSTATTTPGPGPGATCSASTRSASRRKASTARRPTAGSAARAPRLAAWPWSGRLSPRPSGIAPGRPGHPSGGDPPPPGPALHAGLGRIHLRCSRPPRARPRTRRRNPVLRVVRLRPGAANSPKRSSAYAYQCAMCGFHGGARPLLRQDQGLGTARKAPNDITHALASAPTSRAIRPERPRQHLGPPDPRRSWVRAGPPASSPWPLVYLGCRQLSGSLLEAFTRTHASPRRCV
jgi:hypothetical protein